MGVGSYWNFVIRKMWKEFSKIKYLDSIDMCSFCLMINGYNYKFVSNSLFRFVVRVYLVYKLGY